MPPSAMTGTSFGPLARLGGFQNGGQLRHADARHDARGAD